MTAPELQNNPSYHLLLMLPHDEIMPFVEEQFRNKSAIIKVYIGLNILLLAAMIVVAKFDISNGLIGGFSILKYIGVGALLVFTVGIPLHEGLHGLAYKLSGAPKISFGGNWRKFYFYAVADQFVANKVSFFFVALLPFVAINAFSLIPVFFVEISAKWILLGILFFHTTACAGDFAMLGFYEQHRHCKELLTFDDVEGKQSYFYARE